MCVEKSERVMKSRSTPTTLIILNTLTTLIILITPTIPLTLIKFSSFILTS